MVHCRDNFPKAYSKGLAEGKRVAPSLNKSLYSDHYISSRTEKQMARLFVGMYKLSKPFSPGSEAP